MINGLYDFKKEDAFAFANFVGIKVFPKGNELMFQRCPYCNGGRSDRNTFSINLETGQFKCLRASCDAHGNMITLAKDFEGFELSEDVSRYMNHSERRNRYKGFKDAKRVFAPANKTIQFFEHRGISDVIVRKYELTEAKNTKEDDLILVFPFKDENGVLRFIKYRNGHFVKGESQGAKEWCEPNQMPILFGMFQCNLENKTIVLTEGQIDSLSVAEAGIENALSVPTGCNGFTWVPHCWDWLHNFEEVIVFGDYENGSMTLLETIHKRFQFLKVKAVQFEDYLDCKDANEILLKYGKAQLQKCVENAKPMPLQKVRSLSNVPMQYTFDMEKLSTGFRNIDNKLGGGLPFGGVTVITGKAGEGKSTFASQLILEAASQGFGCFVYSGELMNSRFKEWFYLQAAGSSNLISYKKTSTSPEFYKLTSENEEILDRWMDGKVYIYDSDYLLEDDDPDGDKEELVGIIENSIKQYDTRVILIDNLMTAMGMCSEEVNDQYMAQTRFMKKLVRLCIKYNALVLLVAHQRKDNKGTNDDIAGSANIPNLAMASILFCKKDGDDDNTRRVHLMKNRITGKIDSGDGTETMYDEKSRRIAEKGNNQMMYKEYLNFAESWMSIEDMPDEIPWGD